MPQLISDESDADSSVLLDSEEEWQKPKDLHTSSDSDESIYSSDASASMMPPKPARPGKKQSVPGPKSSSNKRRCRSVLQSKNIHAETLVFNDSQAIKPDFKHCPIPMDRFIVDDDEDDQEGHANKKKRHYRSGKRHTHATPLSQFNFPSIQLGLAKTSRSKAKSLVQTENLGPDSSDDDEADFQDIEEAETEIFNEPELLTQMLLREQLLISPDDAAREEKEQEDNFEIVIARKANVTEEQSKRMAMNKLRKDQKSMHHLHVMAFLAFAHNCNRKCDSLLVKHYAQSIFSVSKVESIAELEACIADITPFIGLQRPFNLSRILLNLQSCHKLSPNAAMLLLVAFLRSLGLDTRLITSLHPIPLSPRVLVSHNQKMKAKSSVKTKKVAKSHCSSLPLTREKIERRQRQLISSSSSSEVDSSENEGEKEEQGQEEEQQQLSAAIQVETEHAVFILSGEVYLTSLEKFVPFHVLIPEVQRTLPWLHSMHLLYSFAYHSAQQKSYFNRSPMDIAGRYDRFWSDASIIKRLPEDQLEKLLAGAQSICNAELENYAPRGSNNEAYVRDFCDAVTLRSQLMQLPKPSQLNLYRNHPLYALVRFLKQNECINGPPCGRVANSKSSRELIYPRDCVYQGYTVEAWLRLGKEPRTNEKPCKIVQKKRPGENDLCLFGPWQVEDCKMSSKADIDGETQIPRNKFGNIYLYNKSMLPENCVHVNLTGFEEVAKSLGVDHVPAVVGWAKRNNNNNFHNLGGGNQPKLQGVVVMQKDLTDLLAKWREIRLLQDQRLEQARQRRASDNWIRLVKGLQLWSRIRAQYKLLQSRKSIKISTNIDKRRK